MMYLCKRKGDLLYFKRDGKISVTQSARRQAKNRRCGRKYSRCCRCAVLQKLISSTLATRLGDPAFTLPEPITIESAKSWSE